MKRVYVVLLGCLIGFALSGCGNKEEQAGRQSGQSAYETGAGQSLKKPSRKAATGKGRGLGMVREPTRVVPGWECPSMPGIKSAYPGNCPGTSVPMVRKGEWTSPNNPEISSMGPGKSPIDGVALVKVTDLEKQTGKSIAELTEASLATKNQGGSNRK